MKIIVESFVRDMNYPFGSFEKILIDKINNLSSDTLFYVLPEYCWRLSKLEEVMTTIEYISNLRPEIFLVLGTYEINNNNAAIIIYNNNITYVPKTKILNDETRRGLQSGINPGIFEFNNLKIGVIVCADLWDTLSVYDLCVKQKADILLIPAWTNTTKGNRSIAKQTWYYLVRTISTQYQVIIAVADHMNNFNNYDVGNATIICSPYERDKSFPENDPIISDELDLDLNKLIISRNKWKEKGLYPL